MKVRLSWRRRRGRAAALDPPDVAWRMAVSAGESVQCDAFVHADLGLLPADSESRE